jgi:hypothetical protein
MIGKTIDISVTSVLQTTAGKMIFGKWDERSGSRSDSRSDVRPIMPVINSAVPEPKKQVVPADQPVE